MWIGSRDQICERERRGMLGGGDGKVGRILYGGVFLLVVSMVVGSMKGAEGTAGQCWGRRQFTLSSSQIAEDFDGALLTIERKGQIICVAKDANNLEFEVRVEEVEVNVSKAGFKEKLPEIRPFAAGVSVSREAGVSLSIEITEGKVDRLKERGGLGRQYRTVCRISDMLMATVLTKDVEVAKPPEWATVTVSYPERLKTCEFGVKEAFVYRNRSVPNRFLVLPSVKEGRATGAQLVNSALWQRGVNYYYRLVDSETGLASHAVNLWGSLTEEMEEADYNEVIEGIADPSKYKHYRLHELTVTSIE